MNNLNVHTKVLIRKIIETHDCLLRFLFFYFFDFNFIELIFNLLKIWMRRHYRQLWSLFNNDFEIFLTFVIETNECDKKIWQHFKFNAENYVFEDDYETLMIELNQK